MSYIQSIDVALGILLNEDTSTSMFVDWLVEDQYYVQKDRDKNKKVDSELSKKAKERWKKYRKEYEKGIDKYNKSAAGKMYHRKLGRYNSKNSVNEKREKTFFHTTSISGLLSILNDGEIEANDFVSFSVVPYFGDITGNDVVIAIKQEVIKNQLDKVEYTEQWYKGHTDQAAYIAGEGWREQFNIDDYVSEDDIDEFGDIDPDLEEELYSEAEMDSFLYKSNEREWITKVEGRSVTFNPNDVSIVLVADRNKTPEIKKFVDRLNLDIEVGALGRKVVNAI